jgi:nitrogen regulatory protein P-II 1
MKKIEAILLRSSMPIILEKLNAIGCTIIDKRNLEDSSISYNKKGSRVGSTSVSSVPLSKIDLVTSDKDAREVIEIISIEVQKSSKTVGKIFVSEMTEILDMKTSESEKELELKSSELELKNNASFSSYKTGRNRFVSLQKYTLARIEKIYSENQEVLATQYRIKSFNDFVNHCVMSHLKTIERQLKHPEITYEDRY